MLCQCRTLASLVQLSASFGNIQLASSQHAAQLARLQSCRISASSLVVENSATEGEKNDEIEELTFFDEPSELQLTHASAARGQQPTSTAAEASHARGCPDSHGLANLLLAGTSVQVQVERSLTRIRAGKHIQNNLRRLVQHSTRAASRNHQPPVDKTDSSNTQGAITSKELALEATAGSGSKQHLHQQIVQGSDCKAISELLQPTLRLHADDKALAALHDLWQQAEPPRAVQDLGKDLLNSYDAVLHLQKQYQLLMQNILQQQLDSSSMQVGQQSRKTSTRRRRNTASSNTISSSESPGPAGPGPALPGDSDVSVISRAAQSSTASAAQDLQERVAVWRRCRASVLNQFKKGQLVALFETNGWPLPEARINPQTGRKQGLTKPDYIQALLQHEEKAVEVLIAQQTEAAQH